MKTGTIKIVIITALVFTLQSGTAYAINLGRTVYDSENSVPETVSDSGFDAANPGINFGLCAGFGNIPAEDCMLSPEEIEDIIEYQPADESEYAPYVPPVESGETANSQPETVVKTVYVNTGLSEDEVKALIEAGKEGTDGVLLFDEGQTTGKVTEDAGDEGGKVLGITEVRDSIQPLLDDLNAKVTTMEKELDKSGASLSDIILIILVIILSGLTLRTELRYQQLADKYKNIKKNVSLKIWAQKDAKKQKTPARTPAAGR